MIGDVVDVSPMGPRIDALNEMVKKAGSKAADVVDDWGWKGGKPGEITGNILQSRIDEVRNRIPSSRYLGVFKHNAKDLDAVANQLENSKNAQVRDYFNEQVRIGVLTGGTKAQNKRSAARYMAEDFRTLEAADIPREWTGKAHGAFNRLRRSNPTEGLLQNYWEDLSKESSPARYIARLLSDTLRPMTNDQRQTFLDLLPRWTGTLETLATTAKKIHKRPS
jgi:hypothetical protein